MRENEKAKSSSFFGEVYQVVRMVPSGRVTTYGDIAEYLGTRGSARMVGWAMNAAHDPVDQVPAHRVVNRNGLLTGKHHFGTPRMMQELLESEGVKIADDRVIDFERLRWIPVREMGGELEY